MDSNLYERGNIVLVNLNPQKNNEAGKIRPCVIMSQTDVNNILELVTIIPCTTNLLGEGLFRINITQRDQLDKQCEVMIEQIRGVSKKRIISHLTKVTQLELDKIEKGLKSLLSL
jgi:mRNA interferase MazF